MTSCAMPLLCSTGKTCRYSTAFPLIYVGHLRGRSPSRTHDQIFVACAILQSSYTLVWDMVMDWGLAQQVIRVPLCKENYPCSPQTFV